MNKSQSRQIQFRPRARIIRTIGDQLISGPEAAVIELVKNSYDADASYVIVRFIPPLVAGKGSIEVVDDGHGMTVDDIERKWMEPATSSKVGGRASAKGRRMLGSKGIGRFAAAKLGRKMSLLTVSDQTKPRTATLIDQLDWSVFSDDVYLSDISIDYTNFPTEENTGTTIEILELNEIWAFDKLERLYVELRRLISPIDQKNADRNFRIFLDLSACTRESCGFDGRAIVGSQGSVEEVVSGDQDCLPFDFEVRPLPIISACDYLVTGWFDDEGTFHGSMEIKAANQAPRAIELTLPPGEEEEPCGRVDVQLFIFDRDVEMLRQSMRRAGMGAVTAAKAREFLDEVAGVAIYRDGFRVRPYGDLHADWLSLDSRRVQDPSLRIGHNQIVGVIGVDSQATSKLVERSSREGFEENGAFRRLRTLIIKLLATNVEPRRQDFREKAGISRRRDTSFKDLHNLAQFKEIRNALKNLPEAERVAAEAVISEHTTALDMRIGQIEDRQRMLEAKSSLGLIVGEILHEGAPAANFLASSAVRLKLDWPMVGVNGPKADEIREDFPMRLDLMADAGDRLRNLFLMVQPLAGGARKSPQSFNVINVARSAAKIFAEHDIPIKINAGTDKVYLFGHPEDLTAALINLFSNSIYWLEETREKHPIIEVDIGVSGRDSTISVTDNGPGIDEEFSEKIFDVAVTMKDGGTGLGLNIAREALSRSNSTLDFDKEYEGGARFLIRYPLHVGG